MDNRKIWAIVLMVIMFLSCSGGYLEYGIDFEYATLYGLINMAIVSVIMMIVPFIYYKVNKGLLSYKMGKKICGYNSLIIFLIGIILMITTQTSQSFIGGLGALIFYFVNMAFFTYPKNNIQQEEKEEHFIKNSLSAVDEKKEKHKEGLTYGSDVRLEQEDTNIVKKVESPIQKTVTQKPNSHSKKNNDTVFYIIIAVLIVIIFAIGGYSFFYINQEDTLKTKIKNLESKVTTLTKEKEKEHQNYLDELTENLKNIDKLKFYDDNIVFVIDGYGNYYYTYDQMEQVTQGTTFTYWAYNKEQAMSKGYKAWK